MPFAFATPLPLTLLPSLPNLLTAKCSSPSPTFRRRCARMCASSPTRRETDPRGFVLPSPGDVILYPGRWADEDAAGLVEAVRERAGAGVYVVDIIEMRDVGEKLFETTRRRRWFDIAEVRIASDAEYVSGQDAYRIASARSGFAELPPMDEDAKARADAEYAAMKARMLQMTLVAVASGTVVMGVGFGKEMAAAFGLGGLGSLGYLLLLQLNVDTVGGDSISTAASQLVGLRFLVPALPFVTLALASGSSGGGDAVSAASVLGSRFGIITPQQACAVILGLLTYKIPVLTQTGSEAVDSLAEMPLAAGSTGMLGTVAGMVARAVKGKPLKDELLPANTAAPLLFVFTGPSGVGKSTLIRGLFEKYPNAFQFSVSHTTRPRRDSEVEGVDYYFVDESTFKGMVDEGGFVEHASVHGNLYGTSFASINAVLAGGKSCILDLDIQGVKALAEYDRKGESKAWSPRFVWISPPSMAVLKERLEARGTETPDSLAKRLDTATREISFAATSRVFDLTVINDDEIRAFEELDRFVAREVNDTR